jgi:N-methylhydantoinase A/oxoprolinase/acetone carboxylase beta subunit
MFLGIDVGGTNSDGVLLSEKREVLTWAKVRTSTNVSDGVIELVTKIVEQIPKNTERKIQRVCIGMKQDEYFFLSHFLSTFSKLIGTTHFLNAIIQKKGLVKVSVIRLCGPASRGLPPFCDITDNLNDAIKGLH